MADLNHNSTHTGTVVDGAVTDVVALVGTGLGKDILVSDGSGILVGDATKVGIDAKTPEIQMLGTEEDDTSLFIGRFSVNTNPPTLYLGKGRGAVGAFDTVASGDNLGQISAMGADGVDITVHSCLIQFTAEGTIAENRVPGKINFFTGTDAAPSVLTSRMTINSAGLVNVVGEITAGTKTFRIPHPVREGHELVHSCIEAPKGDLIYRGTVVLFEGKAEVVIDDYVGMTEGTFEVLCRDIQCFTTNESGWTQVKGSVTKGVLSVESETPSDDEVSWIVIGERNDDRFMESATTDEKGRIILEPVVPPPDNPVAPE
tara:strand:+ start:832 stop:1779 length:948 start_codon:yes stop_codon:yes gene_type:complete